MHLCYTVDDGVKRLPDEAKCGQIEEHVEHETTGTRVGMCTTNHHVSLGVYVAKLELQFAQHLQRKGLRLISRDNDRILEWNLSFSWKLQFYPRTNVKSFVFRFTQIVWEIRKKYKLMKIHTIALLSSVKQELQNKWIFILSIRLFSLLYVNFINATFT